VPTATQTAPGPVVPAPVASITVSPTTVSLAIGGTQPLTVTLRDSAGTVLTDRTVTWESGNAATASVSPAGVVTGVAAGTATIAAKSEGKVATAAVTVVAPVLPPSGTVACDAPYTRLVNVS